MPETVLITLEVVTAAALSDPITRACIERLIQRTAQLAGVDRLFAAMEALSPDARRRGLTDEILEAELAAYNAEGRDVPPPA